MTKISALSDIGTSVAANDTFVLVDVSDPTTPNKKIQQQNLFLIPDGTATTPGLRFLNDTNVGLYRPTTDVIGLVTNGTERLRITSTGLVGIGTSSPSSTLDVRGLVSLGDPAVTGSARKHFVYTGGAVTADTTNGITFKPGSASTTDQFVRFETGGGTLVGAIGSVADGLSVWTRDTSNALTITQAGRLGIGSTSPGNRLSISSATADVGLYGTSNVYTNYLISAASIGYTGDANWLFGGSVSDFGIRGQSNIVFGIAANERARIDSSGRLLLGTSSASGSSLLQVNGDTVRIATAKTPASATATGTTGEVCWDTSYIYVCTATNTWKRAALSTW